MIQSMKHEDNKWWVVRTKPRGEFQAKEQLINQGFIIYLPIYKKEQLNKNHVSLKKTSLFPRYIFLEATDFAKKYIHKIRSTYGVTQILKIGEVPIKVPNELIKNLKVLEEEQMQKTKKYFNAGDTVKITKGLYMGLEAVYKMNDGLQRAVVLINMINKATPIQLKKSDLIKV
tara:strand:- start:871 stop:1389 length:519 start_codon:yes stop_codon:yes gene_type:complete